MLKKIKTQKGNASIEMIPVLSLFLLLINFGMGFFGVIHSGILNSIAARNYAFESFRNRSNLNYLRDEASGDNPFYSNMNFRYHGIVAEGAPINTWKATQRPIRFTDIKQGVQNPLGSINTHVDDIRNKMTDETKKTSDTIQQGVSPVWIMTSYGICLNSICEGT